MKQVLLPLFLLGGLTSIAQSHKTDLFKNKLPAKQTQLLNSLFSRQTQGSTAQKPTGTKQRVIGQSMLEVYVYDDNGTPVYDSYLDSTAYVYSGTRGSSYNFNDVQQITYNTLFSTDYLTGPVSQLGPRSANVMADTISSYNDNDLSDRSKAFYRSDNKLDSFFYFSLGGPNVITEKNKQLFNANGTIAQAAILNNFANPTTFDSTQLSKFQYNTAGTQLVTDTIYFQDIGGLQPYYTSQYHYNTQGNLDTMRQYEYNGSGYELSNLTAVIYDAGNRITNMNYFDYSSSTVIADSFSYTGSASLYTYYRSNVDDNGDLYANVFARTFGTNGLPDTLRAYYYEQGVIEDAIVAKYTYNSFNNPETFKAYDTDTVRLSYRFYYETYDDGLAINNIKGNKDLSVYPNPFDNKINIVWNGKAGSGAAGISLVNMVGQRVFSTTKNLANGNNSIDLPVLASGQYILLIQGADGNTYSQKMIKK